MISVTIASPGQNIAAQWDDLIRRAPGNAFMNPVALKAAFDTMFAAVYVLLAWEEGVESARLVGLWALQQRSVMMFWPALLEARPYNYAFLSTPVIDSAFVGEVIPAFFAAIRNHPARTSSGWLRRDSLALMASMRRSTTPHRECRAGRRA